MKKGIILSGGRATRLYPLTAFGISKQVLPLYDKPIIHYPINTLVKSGITDILIIVSPEGAELIKSYVGCGEKWKVNISYKIQEEPRGLADAFILGEDFIGDDDVTLILGDNIFIQNEFILTANTIYTYTVKDPERYGVVEYQDDGITFKRVVEKPQEYVSNQAVVGLYTFTSNCVEVAKNIQPSKRGEIEIVDVINKITEKELLTIQNVDSRMWFDVGTFDSLLACANLIATYKTRTNIEI